MSARNLFRVIVKFETHHELWPATKQLYGFTSVNPEEWHDVVWDVLAREIRTMIAVCGIDRSRQNIISVSYKKGALSEWLASKPVTDRERRILANWKTLMDIESCFKVM